MNKLSPDQQNIIALTKQLSAAVVTSMSKDFAGKPKPADDEGRVVVEAGFQLLANTLIDLNRSANALEVIAAAVAPLAAMSQMSGKSPIIKPRT